MEKIALIKLLVELFFWILKDSDKDGRPDIFDDKPLDPEAK